MSRFRTSMLCLLAMIAFAANSVLCRIALRHTGIDPASFTAIRLIAGAVVLWLLVALRGGRRPGAASWGSSLALFVYATAFSFAYVSLPTATGALLLFGAVQVTMIGYGLLAGERLHRWQVVGVVVAFAGVAVLLMPGLSTPSVRGAVSMLVAGLAWGVYSLRSKSSSDPLRVTAGNFLRTLPFVLLLLLYRFSDLSWNSTGGGYAIASGALASGIGYALWYAALPMMKSTTAATVQLSVPLLAAFGGIAFLAEPVTARLAVASMAVLGGISLVILNGPVKPAAIAR